jgi:hypothetical protein
MDCHIEQVVLTSWGEIHAHARPGWVYRGQRSAAWGLKTSLERCFERESVDVPRRNKLEAELLREFKRAYHNYALHLPRSNCVIEWLSLMQHHGAPTRLLDFTYSIYVAAYFALETASESCAVWAVNADWLVTESVGAMIAAGKSEAEMLRAPTGEEHEPAALKVLFEPPFTKASLLLNPFRLNERLRTQKGAFLVPGDLAGGFMENLCSLPGHERPENLLKIVLPLQDRAIALEKLHYMNISSTSLFPGLDGYARSLGIYHPAFKPSPWDPAR